MRTGEAGLDRWMFRGYHVEPEGLALYRIFYSAVYLIALFPRYSWIASYPDAFWDAPVGPFAWAGGFPPAAVLNAMEWSLAGALFALLIGYRTRWASLAVGGLLVVGDGFVYSIVPTSHLILAPLVPVVLAWSGWGSAWSIDALRGRARRPASSWPVTLLVLLIGLSFFHAGVAKIVGGWLRADSSVVAWYVGRFSADAVGVQKAIAAAVLSAPSSVHEWMDRATVLLEMGMLLAVLVPKTGRIFIAAAAVFHLVVFLLLDIEFAPLLLAYAVVLPWDRAAKELTTLGLRGKVEGRVVARRPLLSVTALTGIFMAFVTFVGPPMKGARSPFDDQQWGTSLVLLSGGALAACSYLAWQASTWARQALVALRPRAHLVELDIVWDDLIAAGGARPSRVRTDSGRAPARPPTLRPSPARPIRSRIPAGAGPRLA